MKAFIAWAEIDNDIIRLKSFKTLKKVFSQNFIDEDPDPGSGLKLIKVATGKDHVCSPHEPEARYANKGGKGWLGFKGQVAETITEGDDKVNFITHVELNEATDNDGSSVTPYIEDQNKKEISPSEVYGDTHYNTRDNIEKLEKDDIQLKGPVAPVPNKKPSEKNAGFSLGPSQKEITCPANKITKKISSWKDGRIVGAFSPEDCDSCDRCNICQPEKNVKKL